jgi:hypothetical protein
MESLRPYERPSSPQARVTEIAIERVHNLGNYSHIRYSLKIELPPGVLPGRPLKQAMHALKALTDKQPHEDWVVTRAKENLKANADVNNPDNDLDREIISEHAAWLARKSEAQYLWDMIGGDSERVDANCNWQDDEDYEP